MTNRRLNQESNAEEIKMQSEFLKRICDFSHFMNKEYLQDCDGDMGMLICAADKTVGNDQAAACHVVVGGEAVIISSLANMMQEEHNKEIFHIAREMSGDVDDAIEDIPFLRRALRARYVLAVFAVLWSLFLIGLKIWGVTDWFTTVSNLALMSFVGFQVYFSVRVLRKRLKRALEQEREARQKHEAHAMNAFAELLKKIVGRIEDDDDDY